MAEDEIEHVRTEQPPSSGAACAARRRRPSLHPKG